MFNILGKISSISCVNIDAWIKFGALTYKAELCHMDPDILIALWLKLAPI